MLNDEQLMPAVARIQQRSERQEDIDKLIGTYVDVGLLPQLNNRNHQIFFGRRGTGKTHVMKVLEAKLKEDPQAVVAYVDCRTLGSTSQFSDLELPMAQRCLALFRDLLVFIQDSLLQYIVDNPNSRTEQSLNDLSDFGSSVINKSKNILSKSVTTENMDGTSKMAKGEMGFSLTTIKANFRLNLARKVQKKLLSQIILMLKRR